MDILLLLAALLLAVTGIVGCIVPVIPGVVLSYAGLLCAYGCSGSALTSSDLWIWAAVTAVVSVIDYLLPGYLTRLFGGSRASVIGATLGVFAGFFLFPPAGIVVCPFLGAVIGELLHDSRDTARALRAGIGSFLAFVAGTGIKLAASIYMLVLIVDDLLPTIRGWFA